MKKISLALVLSGVAVLALAGCETYGIDNQTELKNGHYWQRTDAASAIYQRGPKAQQMLHRDIAKCVYQVRELVRLGAIRTAVPGDVDINGKTPDATVAAGRLSSQDTPERDGYLNAEQTDFHDFETCMNGNGWDRVEYLPYDISVEARDNYLATMEAEKRRSQGGGNNTDRGTEDKVKAETAPSQQQEYEGSLNQ